MSNHPIAVFVIFFFIAFVNWLIRKGAKEGGEGGSPQTPVRPRQAPQAQQSEEERLRKFMEALGVPAGNIPKPRQIVRPQQQQPQLQQQQGPLTPRRVAPVARKQRQMPRRVAPEVVYAPQASPAPTPVQAPQQAYFETEPVPAPPETESVHNTEQLMVPMAVASDTDVRPAAFADLRSLLKSPSSIRSAIMLREILGPPRALQSLDAARSLL